MASSTCRRSPRGRTPRATPRPITGSPSGSSTGRALTVAHIRPTYFAEWLLYLAPMIKAGLLHVPFGTGKHAPIAAEDQGRVIAGILEDPAPHRARSTPSSARSNTRTRRPRKS